MKTILVFVPDLMFEMRVTDVARKLGHSVEMVSKASDLAPKISADKLVVLGLENNREWKSVVQSARAADVPVLAFARHTSGDLLRQARDACCTHVVVNSEIAERLLHLLDGLSDIPTSDL